VIARQRELAALVADAWPTLPCTLAGLSAIDAWGRRRRDVRGCFAAAYRIVTDAVADALRRGEFVDPAWVTRVVLDFAERYRLAVLTATHGLPGPRCWAAALRPWPAGSLAALVALVHAMIAHIYHDLAHTLAACAPMHPHRAADYELLGVIICAHTPAIQRELLAAYVPDMSGVHAALRGADTWLTVTLVRACRGRARTVAGRMGASPAQAVAWSRRLERESAALTTALDILTARLHARRSAPEPVAGPPPMVSPLGLGAPR
jgi:hypothetical protein